MNNNKQQLQQQASKQAHMSGGSSSNTSRNAATRLALLQRDLHDCGFDIVVPFHPQWYNDCLDADERFQHLLRLPSNSNSNTAEEEEEVEAFLIGNTKHLWSFFKAWWLREQQQNVEDDSQQQQPQQQQREKPHLQQQEPSKTPLVASSPQENDASSPLSPPRSRKKNQHPLDSYCQECIEQCVEKHFHQQTLQQPRRQLNSNGIRCKDDDIGKNAECNEQCTSSSSSLSYRIYWSCTFAPDQMVSMQHVAMVSGFAYFDPWTNLCVHPVYGTWHAYRAVAVVLQSKSTPSRCIQENDIRNNANSGANLKRRVPPPPPPRVPCLLSTAEQECARVALARAIGLCTSTSIINSSADSMNSSRSGNTAKKKACFDLLLHGQQDKKKKKVHKNDVKQQDDGGCTGVKSPNGTNKIQRHDDDDKNDDNDYFLSICQAWIDLRDCVQTGKEQYRYDSDQLMYHFTKDKRYLRD
jgi:hypothetical protein